MKIGKLDVSRDTEVIDVLEEHHPIIKKINELVDYLNKLNAALLNSKPECGEKCCCTCSFSERMSVICPVHSHKPKDSLEDVISEVLNKNQFWSRADLATAIRKHLLERVEGCLSWHDEGQHNKLCVYLDDVKGVINGNTNTKV